MLQIEKDFLKKCNITFDDFCKKWNVIFKIAMPLFQKKLSDEEKNDLDLILENIDTEPTNGNDLKMYKQCQI